MSFLITAIITLIHSLQANQTQNPTTHHQIRQPTTNPSKWLSQVQDLAPSKSSQVLAAAPFRSSPELAAAPFRSSLELAAAPFKSSQVPVAAPSNRSLVASDLGGEMWERSPGGAGETVSLGLGTTGMVILGLTTSSCCCLSWERGGT